MIGDGMASFRQLTNTAAAGAMPKYSLTEKCKAFYEERTVGFNRYYVAHGAGESVDKLIRCYRDDNIRSGMYAVMEDGEQYRVTFVQTAKDADDLDIVDVTLERLEDNYDIA